MILLLFRNRSVNTVTIDQMNEILAVITVTYRSIFNSKSDAFVVCIKLTLYLVFAIPWILSVDFRPLYKSTVIRRKIRNEYCYYETLVYFYLQISWKFQIVIGIYVYSFHMNGYNVMTNLFLIIYI